MKHSPGWSYEGLGFYATRLENGQCAAPLVTVNRLYNAAANDSNHRYVTDSRSCRRCARKAGCSRGRCSA